MPTSDPPIIDRTRPPAPGIPKDVSFPDYFEARLPNGFKVIVYERHELPTVTVNIVTRGGASTDGAMPGLASMTAELLTKGTASRDALQIVEEIERLGGSIGSSAGWDSITAGLTILSAHLDRAMDVLGDVVRAPSFPDAELDRYREHRLAAILQRKSLPGALAAMQFARAVYGAHPYGQPSEGTEAALHAMTRGDLAALHARLFTPDNMFLIAVGDVHPDAVLRDAERLFGDWEPSARPPDALPLPHRRDGVLVQVVDRPSAVQSSILVGHVGIERSHPEYIPAMLMNTLFGGYFGSRLNLNLREDKGYTYGAHSRFDCRMQPGPFSAGADVRNEVTDQAVEQILYEMERLRAEPVTPEELDGVKSYVTGNFPIQIETPVQVAQRIVNIELFGLGKTYYNTYNSRVLAVTAEDIHDIARRHLHPDAVAIVAAGRGALLRTALSRFGTVDVFDADGIPITAVESKGDLP